MTEENEMLYAREFSIWTAKLNPVSYDFQSGNGEKRIEFAVYANLWQNIFAPQLIENYKGVFPHFGNSWKFMQKLTFNYDEVD